MPQKKHAIKAIRQSDKRYAVNHSAKENIKYLTKQTLKLAESKDAASDDKLKATIKAIDKAAQRKVLKKNTAARKKSRLIKMLKTIATK